MKHAALSGKLLQQAWMPARWVCILLTCGMLAVGAALPGASARLAAQSTTPEPEHKSDGSEKCESDVTLVEIRRIQRLREGSPHGPALRLRVSILADSQAVRTNRPPCDRAGQFDEHDLHNGFGGPLTC